MASDVQIMMKRSETDPNLQTDKLQDAYINGKQQVEQVHDYCTAQIMCTNQIYG
jgi:hypothetical protein